MTRAIVAPQAARSIFAGQGAVIDLGDDMDPITRARAFQYVELGEEGADKAGGSRPSAYALFRNALREARDLGGMRQDIAGGSGRRLAAAGRRHSVRDAPGSAPARPRRAAQRGRVADALRRRGAGAGGARAAIAGGARRARDRHRQSDRAAPRISRRCAWRSPAPAKAGPWRASWRRAGCGCSPSRCQRPAVELRATGRDAKQYRADARRRGQGRDRAGWATRAMPATSASTAGNLVALRGVPGASGVSWGEALAMITSRPAEAIGMGGEIGRLSAGLSRRCRAVVGRSAGECVGRRSGVDRRGAPAARPTTRPGCATAIAASTAATCPRPIAS